MKKYLLYFTLTVMLGGGCWIYLRYATAERMDVPVTEYANFEYPEDPAERSIHFGHYANRKLTLIKRDNTHFDFILEPTDSKTAKIVFKNIDVSLMTPSEPEWTKTDSDLERIAFTDRQWNRQQVSFDPTSDHIEITGGNGFEKENLYSVELAKNCLNAGLWEVLLFTKEKGNKTLYYQNWFRFPLGHYKNIFEHNTGVSYLKHWYKLEHWSNPQGTPINVEKLRRVLKEIEVKAVFNPNEQRVFSGEQVRKQRTTNATNIITWGGIVSGAPIEFAAFIPPGRYSAKHPWKNEYQRLRKFDGAVLRNIQSPATVKPLQELELIFEDDNTNKVRFIVSGFDLSAIPQLEMSNYSKGLQTLMGIGMPPVFESYPALENNPPDKSPYFSVLLDSENKWINHHDVAIDGSVMHRDNIDPNILHIYLLSYERHTLIGHYTITVL